MLDLTFGDDQYFAHIEPANWADQLKTKLNGVYMTGTLFFKAKKIIYVFGV